MSDNDRNFLSLPRHLVLYTQRRPSVFSVPLPKRISKVFPCVKMVVELKSGPSGHNLETRSLEILGSRHDKIRWYKHDQLILSLSFVYVRVKDLTNFSKPLNDNVSSQWIVRVKSNVPRHTSWSTDVDSWEKKDVWGKDKGRKRVKKKRASVRKVEKGRPVEGEKKVQNKT